MFDRLLVAYDGSDRARDALALGRMLAHATGASLTLACAIYQVPEFLAATTLRDDLRAGARLRLDQGAAELDDVVEAQTQVVEGRSLPGAVSLLAEGEGVSAIVLGSAHRGPVGRVLAGSFGRRILDGAPCPVAVAPAGYRDRGAGPPAVIGLGFDGEPASNQALRLAVGLAGATGASLRVLTAAEPVRPLLIAEVAPSALMDLGSALDDHAKRVLDETLAGLPSTLRADGRVVAEPAAEGLLAEAESGLDLLVVGSRGFGAAGRVLLGSVSARLMDSCPSPLVVVPGPPR